ncbi:MAG TPA: hypothetical protein VGA30_03720 [Actinomycetota bacterium]
MTTEGFDEYERVRAEHRLLVDGFRRWGASEDDASGADDFLAWLGPVPLSGPTERDVIDFLWQYVPRKISAEEEILDSIRIGVGRLLGYLTEQGMPVDPRALGRAADRRTFLRRVRTVDTAGEGWWDELVEALEATGMEPFGALPDGFEWGPIQGMAEARAFDLLKSRLAGAVRSGELEPGMPRWRERSAELQMRWLDAPCPELDGRAPRQAIAREREEGAEHLPGLLKAMGAMQSEGMFRGLGPFDSSDTAPAPTGEGVDEWLIWTDAAEPFPVVSLPDPAELAERARSAPAVRWIGELLEVVGAGRPLTKKGFLTLADGRELCRRIGAPDLFDPAIGDKTFSTKSTHEIEPVELAFRWARAAGLLRVQHGKVLPTRKARSWGKDPLGDWWGLFDAFVSKLEWPARRWSEERRPFYAEPIAQMTPAVLEEAYRRDDGSLRLQAVGRSLSVALDRMFVLSGLGEELPRLPWHVELDFWFSVVRPLALLGAVDAVELGEPVPIESQFTDRWGLDHDPGDPRPAAEDRQAMTAWWERLSERRRAREASRELRLTGLGRWAVRRLIGQRRGAEPPIAGELSATATSVEALLARSAELDLGPEELAEEVGRYAQRVGQEAAARGLAGMLAGGGPSILAVQAALEAVEADAAAGEVRAAMAADGVSAAGRIQCAGWLREHGFEVEMPSPSPEALAEATIWTVVAVSRGDGPLGVKVALNEFDEAEQAAMVEAMGRVGSVYAAEALEAVAWAPLPAKVRKAARTALHRVRSRGG